MVKLTRIVGIALLMLLLLGGCGSSDPKFSGSGTDTTDTPADGSGDDPGDILEPVDTRAATLTLWADRPQMGTAPDEVVTLTAQVKDADNLLLAAEPVHFSTDSGDLFQPRPETDERGIVTAELSPGLAPEDRANRTIRVTATSGVLEAIYDIAVVGTRIELNGARSVTLDDIPEYTVVLVDSAGTGIANQAVAIDGGSNPVAFTEAYATGLTDANGRVNFRMTAVESDILSVSALGASATLEVEVSQDSFRIDAPLTLMPINSCHEVTATWESSGNPVPGREVVFATGRGTLYQDEACSTSGRAATTDGSGVAIIYIQSPNPGPFYISADAQGGPSTSKQLAFVATTPANMFSQPNPSAIGPNESSTITAVVLDSNNNRVQGASVDFSIKQDASAGRLPEVSKVTTDWLGRAQVLFTAGDASTGKDGVVIQAEVVDNEGTPTGITSATTLTVAQQPLFITFGLSNLISAPTDSLYGHSGTVIVTDSNGNYVEGAEVSLSVIPVEFRKGTRLWNGSAWVITDGGTWDQDGALVSFDWPIVCENEDINRDGIIFGASDNNEDGQLQPGNIAAVESNVVTNENGYAEFTIIYPKDYGHWTTVELIATAAVAGTEGERRRTFELLVIANEVTDQSVVPPGLVSPFGAEQSCFPSGEEDDASGEEDDADPLPEP